MAKYKAKINTTMSTPNSTYYDVFSKTKQLLDDTEQEVTVLTLVGTYTYDILYADKEILKDQIADINDKLAAIALVIPV